LSQLSQAIVFSPSHSKKSVTCGRSVVISGYSRILHQIIPTTRI
jgi:hypothetical protein